jgi:hypothetical protein
MAIELMRVSKEGRELIIKRIERRRAMGMPDVAIPVPEDVDAARRAEAASQSRGDTSGVVREAMPSFASAPVAESVLSPKPPASGPIGVAKVKAPEPAAAAAAAPLMTSARDSGQIPTQTIDTSSGRRMVASLAPERARAKRPRVADLIAKAGELSGPVAAAHAAALDEQVDLKRALARARVLAGSDLEPELAALHDVASVPVEISIEAASAELARQLGGKPIARRDRSAKWVAPPAVEMRTHSEEPAAETSDETASAAASTADARAAEVPAAEASDDTASASTADARPAESAASTDAAASPSTTEAQAASEAVPGEPVAEAAPRQPAAAAKLRERPSRARRRKAPEPAPAAALEEPPAASPDAEGTVVGADPHAAFDAKTRAQTEASPSSVLAAVSDVPAGESAHEVPTATSPGLPHADEPDESFDQKTRIPTGDDLADALRVRTMPAHDEPDNFDEKTRIPTGDDLADVLMARNDHRSFANIDEESLRTEPGNRPSSSLLIDDGADAAMLARALEGSQPAMRLSDADIEPLDEDGEGERTHIGQMPEGNPFAEHGAPTHANPHAEQLARELDRQLADAEAEADDDFREMNDQQPAYRASYEDPGYAEASEPRYEDAPGEAGAEEAGEEISDFDVLAEADEADADLLSAHGEADVAQVGEPPAQDDFAARLDLGDDDPAAELDERHHYGSQQRQRASSDVSYTVADRVAQPAPPFASRAAGDDFDEPHGFANVQPTAPGSLRYSPAAHSEDLEDALAALDVDIEDKAQERPRRSRTPSNPSRPLPGLPLHRAEDAGPPAARPRTGAVPILTHPTSENRIVKPTAPPPIPSGARKMHTTPPPLPVRQPPKRATTDEGVLIDFDDDD